MHKFYKPFTTFKSKKEQLKIENELGGDNPVSYRSSRESMSESVLGLRRRNIMLALAAFLLVIFSSTVYAACVAPTNGMTITEDTQFCKGTYTLTDTNNNIKVRGDNIVVDCNGATIQGDFKTKFTTGFSLVGNGITLKNCNIKGYSTCISLTNYGVSPTKLMKNSKIVYSNLSRCDGLAGIFIDGQSDFDISNNRFTDFQDYYERNIGSHAVYISSYDAAQTAQGGSVHHNYIDKVSASGIKINGYGTTKNIKIYSNTIKNLIGTQGDAYGVHLADVSNIAVYNNDFVGPFDSGVVFNIGTDPTKFANNNKVYNNKFTSLDTGVWSKSDNYNNHIYDNTYSKNGLDIRMSSKASFTVYENNPLKLGSAWNANLLYMSFNSQKNFSINAYKLTINNNNGAWNPYNDVRNKNTGAIIASNVKSYSITIGADQEIEVGNYVEDPVIVNQPPNAPVVTMTSNDWTTNSDITCAAYINDPDSTSINTNIQWFKNGAMTQEISINNKQPKTTVTNTLSKTTIKTGDNIYCRARSYDGEKFGEWTYANTITIQEKPPENQPPLAPVISMTSNDWTTNSDITCAAYINDPDSASINTNIQWFKNGAMTQEISINNKQPKTTVTNTLSKTTIKTGDNIYCRARSYDGEKFGEWTYANTITIQSLPSNTPPVINSISVYSYDSTINNDVLCLLNIDDSNDDPMTVTLHWYKNGVFHKSITKYNQHPGEITEPLTKDNLVKDDTWQCRSRVYDGKNYSSWKQSNIITIASVPVEEEKPKKSGGGGGGGSSYSPPVVVEEPIIEDPIIEEPVVEEPIIEEPVQNTVSDDTSIDITTQSVNFEEPIQIVEDVINDNVVLEDTKPASGLWLIALGLMLSGVVVFVNRKQLLLTADKYIPLVKDTADKYLPLVKGKTDKIVIFVKNKIAVPVDQKVLYYILKKLNDGYSYEAISEVLKKKGYKDKFINHHNKVLQSEGHQPFIRHPGPQRYSIPASKKARLISDIQEYTRIHIHEGFRLDEIKQVLLYSGHPMDLIEEAIHG